VIVSGDERLDAAGHFDPRVVAVFAANHADFDRIWRDLHD
jgi:HD-GYP domain-containing protein (c-di-GMP phosphodiesterase class II)